MIQKQERGRREDGGVAAGSRITPEGGRGHPPPPDEENDEPGTARIIPPDVFDELAGRRQLVELAKRLSGYIALAAVGFVLAIVLLKPGSERGSTPVSPAYSPPMQTPSARVGGPGRPSGNAIGRLIVESELPETAWLEIDGRVFTSGLGIDFPLRVVGDTTHRVAVHARGYSSWQSEVYVPADSLIRLSVSLQRLRTARPEQRPTRQVEPARPQPQPQQQQTPPPLAQPTRIDTRPSFPDVLRDSLILVLEEGRVLQQIGRYFDAANQYRYVLDRVAGASVQYRSSSVMEMLRARADSALQAVRLDCRAERREKCP